MEVNLKDRTLSQMLDYIQNLVEEVEEQDGSINLRQQQNIDRLRQFILEHPEANDLLPASVKYHHSEKGGYRRHIGEVMCNVEKLYHSHKPRNGWGFALSSALLVAFLHDLDKVFRYTIDTEEPTDKQVSYAKSLGVVLEKGESKSTLSTKIDNKKNGLNNPIQYFSYKENLYPTEETAAVLQICMEYGIFLVVEEVHAISMHHGGWAILARQGNSEMSKMATLLHCADLMSARITGKLVDA